jgi:hypothetical protein
MSLETTSPSEQGNKFTGHDLPKILPVIGRITSQEVTTSDVDRSFFLGHDAPYGRINGHDFLLERNERNSHLMSVTRYGVQEVVYTNQAMVHGIMASRMEAVSAARAQNEILEDRYFAFYNKGARRAEDLHDEMYLHSKDTDPATGREMAIFSNPDAGEHSEDADGQLKLWLEVPVSEIYSLGLAAPGEKAKKAKFAMLLRQLRGLREIKAKEEKSPPEPNGSLTSS